ncbi:hypothetical protein QL898_11735 [Psychrobacter sp. APC 3279]|uniref:hypothetical protein n=1 Tax=Psychrobacter sp. APC 3279 TaxID=3035189 RepID=UPI0025B60C8D|nr:hypothetical protein [Psychrobacter sp. APC 3279]MDN3442305.1 hypothetical protein [Psychrobacter sp. APC 3279]
MKTQIRNNRRTAQSRNTEAFGIQDGVAGSWVTPNYLRAKPIEYSPGSKQYFESVARQLNCSVEAYKREMENSYG